MALVLGSIFITTTICPYAPVPGKSMRFTDTLMSSSNAHAGALLQTSDVRKERL